MKKTLLRKENRKTWYYNRTLSDFFNFCDSAEYAANHMLSPEQNPVFLCIGSDRITGDCLGPLVGHKLKQLFPHCQNIYGTLEHPVHAKNIQHYIDEIHTKYADPFFIAVDASLGLWDHIGYITFSHKGLIPGEGVKKRLPSVGNISVTGIVNSCQGNTDLALQNTRLHLVNELSDFICMGLANGFSAHFMS